MPETDCNDYIWHSTVLYYMHESMPYIPIVSSLSEIMIQLFLLSGYFELDRYYFVILWGSGASAICYNWMHEAQTCCPVPPVFHILNTLSDCSVDLTCSLCIKGMSSYHVNSYSASHDNWCTVTLWNRIMTAQCEGMGEVGSARYEPALLPPCPSIRVLSYSNCQEIHSRQQTGLAV